MNILDGWRTCCILRTICDQVLRNSMCIVVCDIYSCVPAGAFYRVMIEAFDALIPATKANMLQTMFF